MLNIQLRVRAAVGLCESVFCHCDKIPEENQLPRRKSFFWLSFALVSVYGWSHCFAARVETEHHSRECVVEQSCLLHEGWEAREREGAGVPMSPSRTRLL
jgi:hypothetical protein